ncbi:MAG: radical SAM protein [Thermodesulfobacteriota bacterium]
MTICSIPQLSYQAFGHQIRPKIFQYRIPYGGALELTYRCNLHCVHCYCNLPPHDRSAKTQELTYSEICQCLDEMADAGCLRLLITGGEPLLRPDFWEIYSYAKGRGFIIELFTNGTLMTSTLIEQFAEYPPCDIEITIYGLSEKTHERITRSKGSFRKTHSAIKHILAKKLSLTLKTVVMTLNKDEFLGIKRFAETLGVRFRFDPFINPRLDGSPEPSQWRLSPQEVIDFDFADKKRAQQLEENFKELQGLQTDSLYLCSAGLTGFNVNPYGQVSPCTMTQSQGYNLRSIGFSQGWQEIMPKLINQRMDADFPCRNCELVYLCEQCPGWAELEKGNPQRVVDFLCQVTQLRQKNFGSKEVKRDGKEKTPMAKTTAKTG